MINCQECVDFITDYIEGNLPKDVAAEFKTHLEKCPPCVQYIESYRQTIDATKCLCCDDEKNKSNPCPEDLIQTILKLRKDCNCD